MSISPCSHCKTEPCTCGPILGDALDRLAETLTTAHKGKRTLKEKLVAAAEAVQSMHRNAKNKWRPTVGGIVHYTNLGDADGRYPPEIQAAVVTKVYNATEVALCVFYPTCLFFMERVEQAEHPAGTEGAQGLWNWPTRVEP